MSQPSYPVLLHVSDRLCVIVGGGAVAVRKAQGLINAGAQRVRMIAPVFAADVPQTVQKLREPYRSEHLMEAGIVFAATDSTEVNDGVVRDAQALRILVCRVDGEDRLSGDFVNAAYFKNGAVTVAVSAGAPALSVMIRDQLAARYDPTWTDLANVMTQLRPEIKQRWNETARRNIFRDLATAEALDVLASGGIEGVRQWIRRRHGERRGGRHGDGTRAGT